MDITRNDIDELNATVNIRISPDDYKEKVDGILKEHSKKATMPGFRPGKVPFGMIKKMYGKSVLAEELNKMLSESLHGYINENNVSILGGPLPKNENGLELDKEEEFEFDYDIGLAPQFDVNISDKEKFTMYTIKVDDKLLDKYVMDLRKRQGKVQDVEVAGEEDLINGIFYELDANDTLVEGGIHHHSTIAIEHLEDEGMKKELIGLKVGDTKVVDPRKVSRGEGDLAALLGVSAAEAENISTNFQLKVEKVHQVIPADVNQELFDRIFGPGKVNTEEELREKVSEQLTQMLSRDADNKFRKDISEKLLAKLNLALPDEFLKRWIHSSNDEPVSMEQIEKDYEDYAKSLKWRLIENKISEEQDVKVSNEELVEKAKVYLKEQLVQYGQTEFDEEMLNNTAQQILGQKEEAQKLYEQVYEEKMLAMYKETFKLSPKEVTFDEFVKIATAKPGKASLLDNLNNLIKFK